MHINTSDKSIISLFHFILKLGEHRYYSSLLPQAGNAHNVCHPMFDAGTASESIRYLM